MRHQHQFNRLFSLSEFLDVTMFIRGQFYIDPFSRTPYIKWGQKVIKSGDNSNHDGTEKFKVPSCFWKVPNIFNQALSQA